MKIIIQSNANTLPRKNLPRRRRSDTAQFHPSVLIYKNLPTERDDKLIPGHVRGLIPLENLDNATEGTP